MPWISGKGLGHLTYSTLVHATDDWDQLWKSVNTYLPAVKARMAPHEKFGVCLRTSAPSAAALSADPGQARHAQAVFRRPGPLSLHRQRLRLRRLQEAGHQGRRLRAGLADAGAPRVHQAGGHAARGARSRGYQSLDPERAARLQAQGHGRSRRRRDTRRTSSTSWRIWSNSRRRPARR